MSLPKSEADEFITIGKIGASHGVKGEFRVIPLTDFPDRFMGLKKIYINSDIFTITSCRYNKQFVILKLEGVESREEAARLNGELIQIKRADAMPLEEGEYYTFDIVGLSVEDTNLGQIGFVKDVLKTGSNDVYLVGQRGEKKEYLVPALKSVVKKIDLGNGTMLISLPEEYDA